MSRVSRVGIHILTKAPPPVHSFRKDCRPALCPVPAGPWGWSSETRALSSDVTYHG